VRGSVMSSFWENLGDWTFRADFTERRAETGAPGVSEMSRSGGFSGGFAGEMSGVTAVGGCAAVAAACTAVEACTAAERRCFSGRGLGWCDIGVCHRGRWCSEEGCQSDFWEFAGRS